MAMIENQFVGREDALNVFYARFAYRHMQNGVYYVAAGGLGKSWLLEQIMFENQKIPTRTVKEIIDFSDTQNHNVRGLQFTIKGRLNSPEDFRTFDEVVEHLNAVRQKEDVHPSMVASLETRANRVFIRCCQEAVKGKEIILFFDTFEKVQDLFVGKWFVEMFLPEVRDPIVVIAGRPEPQAAKMPDNVVVFKLSGLSEEEVKELLLKRMPAFSQDVVHDIWYSTNGAPLLINLICDLHEPLRSNYLSQLGDGVDIRNRRDLQKGLMGLFAERIPINFVIWAMAYLKRRFDLAMLNYLVKNSKSISFTNYEGMYDELKEYVYIKRDAEQQVHLLHDEIQRMVSEFILDDVDHDRRFRNELYDLIVNHYYPILFDEAQNDTNQVLAQEFLRHYRVEQIGYIFDRDVASGITRYEELRNKEIDITRDYDFEELLWGETRQHLSSFSDSGYQVCKQRGSWLFRNSLFQKAAEHYQFMLTKDAYMEHKADIMQSYGFMLMRDGEIEQSIDIFEQSISFIATNDFRGLATVENNLGQAKREGGKWGEAINHFGSCIRYASLARDESEKVGAYINRGELYSLQGKYESAKNQCVKALEILEKINLSTEDNIRRFIYAKMYLGMAFRHSGNYEMAKEYYDEALKIANDVNNREAICRVLQELGINSHLMGRKLRRDFENVVDACVLQTSAWQYLTDALEIAWEVNARRLMAHGLNRLAKVYREIHYLTNLVPSTSGEDDARKALKSLTVKAEKWEVPMEIEYEMEWLIEKPFSKLNWQEKALRLFELSAWIAEESNEFHRVLDSLTEESRLLLALGQVDDINLTVNRIDRTKGHDYQEDLFWAMSQITLGDLEYRFKKNFDVALGKYRGAYLSLAQQTGYATYLLQDRLRDLEWRVNRSAS